MRKRKYKNYELELIKYQWESLRTNSEYIKEYEQLQKLYRKPKFDSWRFQPRLEYYFKKKYGVEPLDPSTPFLAKPVKIPKDRKQSEKELLQYVLWMYFVDLIKAIHYLYPEQEKLKNIENQHTIPLLITLDASLPKIIAEVSEIVKNRKRKMALTCKQQNIRHRLREYKNYFRVYKLVKKKLTWKNIAKRCYLNDYERDKNYAIRKVKRDYERWKKIGFLFKKHPLLAYRMTYRLGNNPPELLTNQEYYKYLQEHCKKAILNN